jgi:L-asparagine transporter-like permease
MFIVIRLPRRWRLRSSTRNAVRDLPFRVVLFPYNQPVLLLFLDAAVASKTNELSAIEEANAVPIASIVILIILSINPASSHQIEIKLMKLD